VVSKLVFLALVVGLLPYKSSRFLKVEKRLVWLTAIHESHAHGICYWRVAGEFCVSVRLLVSVMSWWY